MARPLLVLAAYAPELAPLGHALPARARTVTTALVGIGAVEAAAGAAQAIAAARPSAIILVGTAGLYRVRGKEPSSRTQPRPGIGTAVVARRVMLASLAVARELAYLPAPMLRTSVVRTDAQLRGALVRGAALAQHDVACPLGITRSAAAAASLSSTTGATLENLEAFAVARAAARAQIPFAAVLGIANHVGPRAHLEWRANAERAVEAACAALVRWLERR